MIKSIFISAIRNLFRNKSFSLINLIGLSISMSLSLLIILIIKSQYAFDTFHHDPDMVYRINTEAIRVGGGTEKYASVPLAVATALMEEYGYVDKLVRIDRQFGGDVTFENTQVGIHGLFTDPAFLEVFNFPLEKGTAQLQTANTVVITQECARKVFGNSDPIGKTITVAAYGTFTVTGVLRHLPGPTHLEFEALASMASMPVLEKENVVRATLDDLNNYYTGYAYIKLQGGVKQADVEQALEAIVTKHYADVQYETRDKGYRFYLQPLESITPGPALSNSMGTGMPDVLLIFMGVLAAIVMLMACFNYTQLMIAKSLTRAREIGVRKIVGAQRWQVFMQFIGESVVFSIVALFFSYGLLQVIKPGFMQLHLTHEFTVDLKEDAGVLVLFLLFALFIGIIAGLLPAGYLSAFKSLKVLRGAGDLKVYARLTLRKVLMVTQFSFSLVFILMIMIVYQQVDYMMEADYGFNQSNLMNIRLQGQDYERIATEVSGLAGVESVGGVSHSLGTWEDGDSDYRLHREDEPFVMRDFSVDENYLQNLEVPLVAGHHLSAGIPRQVILNETALEKFDFNSPQEAIGNTIIADDSTELTVVGVVSDFHFRPLSYAVGPVAFRYDVSGIAILNIRVANNLEATIGQLETIWKKLNTHPIDLRMVDNEIDQAYESFFDILSVVGYITLIAITLACLGMLGMAMYTTQTRVKEVGVRKIMGASVLDILLLLSKSYLILIMVAVIIAAPLSYFLGAQFLNLFAFRISITPWLLLPGIGFLVALATTTIVTQTWRAAVVNPVESLRYE
ncbi:MAG: ABC transporter permease [Cyclobacteriaceae bacterium]|nr:ABC transporter permease [Cyclobacteriaceae bacterium]